MDQSLSACRRATIPLLLLILSAGTGCATIRTSDPPRTATEQFLLSTAIRKATDQLSADSLRDRMVYVDTTYLILLTPQDAAYLTGELRTRLLQHGARITNDRSKAQVVVEARTGGVGIDRLEYLLGIPAFAVPAVSGATGNIPILTPELAIVKSTRQRGFASIAFAAYWADTGELLTTSGPFVGRTFRDDWWLFGTGPKTEGDIATVQPMRPDAAGPTTQPAGAGGAEPARGNQPVGTENNAGTN